MSNKITIKEQEFEITSLNANKVATISNLLGTLIIKGRTTLNKLKAVQDTGLVFGVLASLEGDDLVKLAAIIVGCDEEFAKDNFDLVWFTEALNIQAKQADFRKIVENFTALFSQIQ